MCGSAHLLQIDHVVPWALGGRDHIANLLAVVRSTTGSGTHAAPGMTRFLHGQR